MKSLFISLLLIFSVQAYAQGDGQIQNGRYKFSGLSFEPTNSLGKSKYYKQDFIIVKIENEKRDTGRRRVLSVYPEQYDDKGGITSYFEISMGNPLEYTDPSKIPVRITILNANPNKNQVEGKIVKLKHGRWAIQAESEKNPELSFKLLFNRNNKLLNIKYSRSLQGEKYTSIRNTKLKSFEKSDIQINKFKLKANEYSVSGSSVNPPNKELNIVVNDLSFDGSIDKLIYLKRGRMVVDIIQLQSNLGSLFYKRVGRNTGSPEWSSLEVLNSPGKRQISFGTFALELNHPGDIKQLTYSGKSIPLTVVETTKTCSQSLK